MFAQTSREEDGFHQRATVAKPRHAAIGHRETQGTAPRCSDETARQSYYAALLIAEGFSLQLLHALAHFHRGGCARQRRTEAYGDGVGDPARKLPQELAAGKT